MTATTPTSRTLTTGPLCELASGVDALYLSGSGQPRPQILDTLESIRSLAGKVNQPLPAIVDDDLTLVVAPHGWGKYRYCCDHPTARIGLTTSRHLPPVRVQPRSEYLHGAGPATAIDELSRLVGRLCDDLCLSVARLDLYADWQGWALSPADKTCFVGRADTSRTWETAGRVTGFDFGSRTNHTLIARIYDKTLDANRKSAEWWLQIWGDRYQPGPSVHRVEFEFSRQALREFELTTPTETLAAQADL